MISRLLFSPVAQEGASTETPAQTIARLTAENEQLRGELARRTERDKQLAEDDAEIVTKMVKGLTREQAQGVILRQREFDAKKGKKS